MSRLKRLLLLFGVTILLIPGQRAFSAETIRPQDIYKNADFVCKVLLDYEIETFDLIKNSTATFYFPETRHGSCVAISFKGKTLIVTAAHLTTLSPEEKLNLIVQSKRQDGSYGPVMVEIKKVSVSGKVYFKNDPEKIIEVTPEQIDTDFDLAILKPKNPEMLKAKKGVPVGEKEIEVADSVFTIGNPQDLDFIFTSGKISAILSNKENRYILTEPMIDFGNSGGPLLDENGRCIGIAVQAFFKYNIKFGVFVHRDDLKSYLEKINQ